MLIGVQNIQNQQRKPDVIFHVASMRLKARGIGLIKADLMTNRREYESKPSKLMTGVITTDIEVIYIKVYSPVTVPNAVDVVFVAFSQCCHFLSYYEKG